MKDFLHNLLKHIDYNRWTYILLALTLVGSALFVGCQPTTNSILTPGKKVDALALQNEVLSRQLDLASQKATLEAGMTSYNAAIAQLNGQIEASVADLERQDALRQQFLDLTGQGLVAAANGALNPAEFILPGLSLLGLAFGVGKTVDSRRKDVVISDLKGKNNELLLTKG